MCCVYSFSYGIHSALVFARFIVSSPNPGRPFGSVIFNFGSNLKNRLPSVVWLVNLIRAPLSSKDSQPGFKLIRNSIHPPSNLKIEGFCMKR